MKLITAILLLVLSTSTVLGEPTSTSLPSAPVAVNAKPHVFTAVDYSLAAGVITSNLLDFSSTETGLSHPASFREAVLPQSLVKNESGFFAYKAGITSLTLLGEWELARHGHRRISRIAAATVIGLTLRTDIRNYQLDSLRPVAYGMRPIHPAK